MEFGVPGAGGLTKAIQAFIQAVARRVIQDKTLWLLQIDGCINVTIEKCGNHVQVVKLEVKSGNEGE